MEWPSEAEREMALRAMTARISSFLLEEKLIKLHEEEEAASTNAAEFISEEEGLPEDTDVIRMEDLDAAPAKLDDLKADVQDPLEEINLGDVDRPRPVFVNQLLPDDVKAKFIQLLNEFICCFAWDYDEMPGLSRDLVEHKLPILPGFMPFKQPPRRMSSEVELQVKEEIERLLRVGFIRTARYVT